MSWWAQELPSGAEMIEGQKNLARHNYKVDFIISHCAASSIQTLIGGSLFKPDKLTAYFEEIRRTTEFKKWFFGHYHDNKNVSAKDILLWEQMIQIA